MFVALFAVSNSEAIIQYDEATSPKEREVVLSAASNPIKIHGQGFPHHQWARSSPPSASSVHMFLIPEDPGFLTDTPLFIGSQSYFFCTSVKFSAFFFKKSI